MGGLEKFAKRYPIALFILFVLVPVHGILWPLRLSGVSQEFLKPLKLLFALLPSISAFAVVYLAEGEEAVKRLWRRVFLKKRLIGYYLFALVGIAALGSLSIQVRFMYDLQEPVNSDLATLGEILLLVPFLLFFPGFTEEFGWRGFLQQKLQKRWGVFLASLFTGLVWGSWHGMDFLMGNWPFDAFNVGVFYAYIVGTSIVIGGYYYLSKGSVAAAILAHFSANIVNFFLPVWNNSAGTTTPLIFIGLLWLVALFIGVSDLRRYYWSRMSVE